MTKNIQGDKLTYCVYWRGFAFKGNCIYRINDSFNAIGEDEHISAYRLNEYDRQIFRRLYKNELKLKIN